MFTVGNILHLKGKTSKGKNRVREHGTCWVITRITAKVLFSDDRGPWALVEPEASQHPNAEHAGRWINLSQDSNFSIESIDNNNSDDHNKVTTERDND